MTAPSVSNGTTRSLIWFRKALRVHDNPALAAGIARAKSAQPVFVLDPWFCKPSRVGANRMRFLLQSLRDLDATLRERGSSLLVLHGEPRVVLPRACKTWKVDLVTWEHDIEPYAKMRDTAVRGALERAGVECASSSGHTLYDVEEMLAKCHGKPPTTYSQFLKIVDKMGAPAAALDAPKAMPAPFTGTAEETKELVAGVADAYGIPTLEELGYEAMHDDEGFQAIGGETEGLRRLRRQLSRTEWVHTFQKPDTNPTTLFHALGAKKPKPKSPFEIAARDAGSKNDATNTAANSDMLMTPSTTALSPYMKFGCVSPRVFYHELNAVLAKFEGKGQPSQPPVSLMGQLMWREFYYLVGAGTPNFDKMEGNPICRQIPWNKDRELFAAWENAQTGFPWIDAAMTQLRLEGWIHHLARHAVACFLTRGDLFVHWEWGRDAFDRDLVDADWALNNGNWMWLSCSCFFYQYFRVYGPHSFAKKYDKDGAYVKHYLPVLKNMPAKYVYEPWLAPLDVQKKAGCVVGVDYPAPIVDHATASKACIDKIATAYAAHKDATAVAGKKRKAGE
jgi:cryptochrome